MPEPTSVENAYRFLKSAFFRRLAVVEKAYGIKDLVDDARASRGARGIHTPAELLKVVAERNPDVGRVLHEQMGRFMPRLVLNQARSDDDAMIAQDMASACRRFLGIRLEVLGILPEDEAVRRAVRQRQSLLQTAPDAPITRALQQLAERVLAAPLEQEAAV